MSNGNSVTLVGNITRDPELRYTPSGFTTVGFGLAVNRRRPNREQPGEFIEETSFFNVKVLGDMADNVAETLQKGARVIVTGRLEQRSWETDNGEKRSTVEIVADEVGPSLRWATAKVERTERKGGDGGGMGGGGGNAGGRPVSNEPPPGYGYDEEPF